MIMTTIGFGDIYPVTVAGRSFMTVTALLILIIFSMLISTVIDKCSLCSVEYNNFTFLKRIDIRSDIKNNAQKFIKQCFNKK